MAADFRLWKLVERRVLSTYYLFIYMITSVLTWSLEYCKYFDYTLLFLVSLQIRVVCLSDTHSLTSHMKRPIPNGDILIHAGDFTRCGNMKEVRVQERVVVRGDTYMTSALSGGGELPNTWQTLLIGCVNAWQRGEGVQNPENFADVI